ncbi:MAG TPA: hypothetical protein ENK11_10520 [Phycisphaerales bacterium]|nr:hypothetical protein [Phycisphaerales bacterium]
MSRTTIILLISAILLALPGCVGYVTYPPADWQTASDDINGPPADELMIAALGAVIDRFPPPGGAEPVLNLPPAVKDRVYGVIVDRVGRGARAMAPGLESEPTYHVTRIWARGAKAEVDVLRPVGELGPSPSGEPIVQAVTVYLEGGLNRWRVVRMRPWVIGAEGLPEPHYIGVDDAGPAEGAGG